MRVNKDNSVDVETPEGIEVTLEGKNVTVKGPKGSVTRCLPLHGLPLEIKSGLVKIKPLKFSKFEKKIIGSIVAHIKQMIHGVQDGIIYKLKVCSGHFPMTTKMNGRNFIVNNFIGEKHPRTHRIKYENVDIKIDGDIIIVTGIDNEFVAQTAASIELLMKRPNFDRRIFQDGIYIIEKDGKAIK